MNRAEGEAFLAEGGIDLDADDHRARFLRRVVDEIAGLSADDALQVLEDIERMVKSMLDNRGIADGLKFPISSVAAGGQ